MQNGDMITIRATFVILGLCTLILCSSSSNVGCSDPGETVGSATSLTPPPGDPARKAVLDALRSEMKHLHGLDVVFIVRHLRIQDGWAWVHTEPRSPDGTGQYEDVSALLGLEDGVWKVAEIPCTEVDNPECLDGPEYFTILQHRFPGVPAGIFPDWAGGATE